MGFIQDPIKSVTEYLDRIKNCIGEKDVIFRGQDRYFEPKPDNKDQDSTIQRFIKSGATRRLEEFKKRDTKIGKDDIKTNDKDNAMNKDLYLYSYNLFYFARKKRYHINGTNELTFFEMMAELQHFGAATMLIDFTKNTLVALFFACKSTPKNDGCVFVMEKPKNEYKEASDCFDKNIDNMPSKQLWEYFPDYFEELHYWEPASLNMRIPAQHSIFVFGKPEINQEKDFIDVIRVDNEQKETILKELNDIYDINDITLFNDLPGFASANCAESKIDNELYNSEQAKKSRDGAYYNKKQINQNEIVSLKSKNDAESKTRIIELLLQNTVIDFFNDDYKNAIEILNQVLEIDTCNDKAYFYKGVAYGELRAHNEAIANYTKTIELNPNIAVAYYGRGFAHGELGEYDEAIDDYTKAIELNPNDSEAYYGLGIVHGDLNEHKEAIADYTKAIELNPNLAKVFYNRGSAHGKLNEYREAIADYTKAIELNPNYSEAYCNRGNAYLKFNEYKEAIADYTKAIEQNPNLSKAYYNRGVAHGKLNEYREAIADYTKAIELNPDYAKAYHNRGIDHVILNEYKEAIADYTKAIELNPNFAETFNNRGVAHCELNEYKEAIEDYNKAIGLDPNDAKTYSNRGIAHGILNEHKEAIEDYSKAIELNPNFAETFNNRGVAHCELNEYIEAIADFSRAIELNPNFAETYYNRGFVYGKTGDKDKAEADFKKAKELKYEPQQNDK